MHPRTTTARTPGFYSAPPARNYCCAFMSRQRRPNLSKKSCKPPNSSFVKPDLTSGDILGGAETNLNLCGRTRVSDPYPRATGSITFATRKPAEHDRIIVKSFRMTTAPLNPAAGGDSAESRSYNRIKRWLGV